MKTSLKKLVAGASIVALVAMNALSVNGAAVNNATAVVNAWIGVVVTSAWSFAWANTCSATITKTKNDNTGVSSVAVTSCTVTGNDTLTLAAATVAANEYYTIAFTTDNWVYGTTTAGGTTNNVAVSARVLPVLSLALSNSAVDLWTLTDSAISNSTTGTTITVKTNAVDGYIVSAAATDFVWTNTANVIPFVSRSDQVAGTEGFSIDVASVGQWAAWTSTVDATAWLWAASTFVVGNLAASLGWASTWLWGSIAGTTNGDTLVVNYAAAVSSVTEADSYSTTVTYTVTGSF